MKSEVPFAGGSCPFPPEPKGKDRPSDVVGVAQQARPGQVHLGVPFPPEGSVPTRQLQHRHSDSGARKSGRVLVH